MAQFSTKQKALRIIGIVIIWLIVIKISSLIPQPANSSDLGSGNVLVFNFAKTVLNVGSLVVIAKLFFLKKKKVE